VLDSVINNFGCYSGKILEKMTHSELPWLIARKGLSDKAPSNKIIKKELIESYFNQIKAKYDIINKGDIKDIDLFNKLTSVMYHW
jgi:hypothetical protein